MGMHIQERGFFSGEKFDPPKINWDEEDRYAIIAFLLMSLNGKPENAGMIRFDDLFGLGGDAEGAAEADAGEEEEDTETRQKRETRNAIERECGKFLAGLDDEERYDAVQDEIDKFIEGNDGVYGCAIGGGYGPGKLDGGPYRLWDMALLVVFDKDYPGSKRRLLKHLARKWNIDPQTLPMLESTARRFRETGKERRELEESGMSYREVKARLAALEQEEGELWRELKKHGIAENRETSAFVAMHINRINSWRAISGLQPIQADLNELEELAANEDEDEEEEPDLGEKIADSICEGIDEFTNTVGECIEGLGSFIAESIETVTSR
jgi:hypothetical protein